MENKTEQKSSAMSSAAKATWANPSVAAKRAQRTKVSVTVAGDINRDHGQFRSVADAFKSLSLPAEKHAAFRLKLKESDDGVLNFQHADVVYKFRTS